MNSIGHHSNTRLRDSRIIAPTVAHRRLLARTFLEQSRGIALLSFSAPDTHLHLVTAGSEGQAAEMVRRVKITWRARTGVAVGFIPAWHEPVQNQRHLYASFKYVLTQDLRHGCRVDPYFEGTVLPDLLGMRIIRSEVVDNVRAMLPRVTSELLLDAIGLSREALGLIALEEVSLDKLAAAAAAAAALPDIASKQPAAVAAKSAAVRVGSRLTRTEDLARRLGIGVSSVKRLRANQVAPELVRAVELQLRFREAVDRSIDALPLEDRRWVTAPREPGR